VRPRVLILHATGTNRDREAAWAIEAAGGVPEIVLVGSLDAGDRTLDDYQMLLLPGGFSYGDDLGAGKLWANALRHRLGSDLSEFVAAGKPVLGICNGFQALVKSGLLPGWASGSGGAVTLTRNESARFECRWVELAPEPGSKCIFVSNLVEPVLCPVAHGEGRFVADATTLDRIESAGMVALRYASGGSDVTYPANPNGSMHDIAGITNPAGTILGLMPHPEDHIAPRQHPAAHRSRTEGSGLPLIKSGIDYAAQL
jgi:phosphoribosylformylglycinamidine synthase I